MTPQTLAVAGVNTLPAATIKHAQDDNTLYPISAIEGTVATIAFEGMEETTLTLHWVIKGQAEPTFSPIEKVGSASGTVDIDVPWQWVGACIGHSVLIWYTATVGGQLKESVVLELTIEPLRNEDLKSSLPKFVHAEVIDFTVQLDMHRFTGDETVTMKAWPFIQAGQRLFVGVGGHDPEPPMPGIWLAYDHVVTVAEAKFDHVFEFKLPRGWLTRRLDRSRLTAESAVIFSGCAPIPAIPIPDPVRAVPFPENAHPFRPVTSALLRVEAQLSEFDDFETYPRTEFGGPGTVIDTNLLKFETVAGSGSYIGLHQARGAGEHQEGMVEGQALAVHCGGGGSQLASLHLKYECTKVRFGFSGTGGAAASFSFFDAQGTLLETQEITPPAWIESRIPEGDTITRIDIRTSSHGSIDSLTTWRIREPGPV
jgi:hypothetical protein